MLPLRFRALALASLLTAPALLAQDITVTPFAWVFDEDPPSTLPTRGAPGDLSPPAELEALDRPTYARIREVVGKDGLAWHRTVSTEMPWLINIAYSVFDGVTKHSPAKRGGAVVSEIEYFVVFNPKSARQGANTTPRLLQPVSVKLPDSDGAENVFLEFDFSVDENGKVADLVPTTPSVSSAVVNAVRATLPFWKFAAAQKGGKRVAAHVTVPVLFVSEPVMDESKVDSPPQVTYREAPRYPLGAKMEGVPGRATVTFVVDVEGRAREVEVLWATHRVFGNAAAQAIKGWRYRPAMHQGQPVNTQVLQEIHFVMGDRNANFLQVVADPKKIAQLPPALQWDQPPEYSTVYAGTYPFEALLARNEGSARLAFVVSPEGKVIEMKVVSATSPELASAASTLVESFGFSPASLRGKPSHALLSLDVKYSLGGTPLVPMDRATVKLAERVQQHPGSFARVADLDRPLRQKFTAPAPFPLAAKTPVGSAEVEFVIDPEGVVLLPRVVSATDPAFGYAAAQAISTRRYAIPRKSGKPVEVLARDTVEFRHESVAR